MQKRFGEIFFLSCSAFIAYWSIFRGCPLLNQYLYLWISLSLSFFLSFSRATKIERILLWTWIFPPVNIYVTVNVLLFAKFPLFTMKICIIFDSIVQKLIHFFIVIKNKTKWPLAIDNAFMCMTLWLFRDRMIAMKFDGRSYLFMLFRIVPSNKNKKCRNIRSVFYSIQKHNIHIHIVVQDSALDQTIGRAPFLVQQWKSKNLTYKKCVRA